MTQETRGQPEDWRLLEAGGPAWIWPAGGADVNQFVEFHHEFDLAAAQVDEHAALDLSVDTNYAAWVNGVFVGCGQYSDYPDHKTYDRLPIGGALAAGRNTLALLAYYQGQGTSVYSPGQAGLVYRLTSGAVTVISGEGARWRHSRCYASGPLPLISRQLTFTFAYDSQQDDGWTDAGYQPSAGWHPVSPRELSRPTDRRQLRPRPVARLDLQEASRVCVSGGGFQFQDDGFGRRKVDRQPNGAGLDRVELFMA